MLTAADYRATKEAEAAFFSKKKEAEGITEMAKAYGQMSEVLGGPQGSVFFTPRALFFEN